MNKHNHVSCIHSVDYCAVCDVCHCRICGKEWRQSYNNWVYYPYTPQWTGTDSVIARGNYHVHLSDHSSTAEGA